jgi:hypothetical protein
MQTYWDGATNRWVTKMPDGTVRAATSAEALLAYSNGASAPVGAHGPAPGGGGGTGGAPSGNTYTANPATGLPGGTGGQAPGPVVLPANPGPGGPGGIAPPPPPPAPPPPVSYDPQGGGPTYTPGISFGQGTLPGHGENYQRQWFDVGPNGSTEGLNQTYYDDPGNWGYAWDKVLNQFGGQVGGDFYKFLQGFSNTARGDFQNTVPYDPNLHVANFLDQYAPQIAGVYKLQPSAQTHGGGSMGLAGRATY